jgi:hypothetical protein
MNQILVRTSTIVTLLSIVVESVRGGRRSRGWLTVPTTTQGKKRTAAFALYLPKPKETPPPPSISMPVWSLATPIKGTGDTAMNIVTFASPVSDQYWTVALYADTLTRESFYGSGVGILQLLTPEQRNLVPILGQHSGYDDDFDTPDGFNKRDACASIQFPWIPTQHSFNPQNNRRSFQQPPQQKQQQQQNLSQYEALDVLPRCAAYIKLNLLQIIEAGDHDVALCGVAMTGIWDYSFGQVRLVTPNDLNNNNQYGPPIFPNDPSNTLYTALLRQQGIIN